MKLREVETSLGLLSVRPKPGPYAPGPNAGHTHTQPRGENIILTKIQTGYV